MSVATVTVIANSVDLSLSMSASKGSVVEQRLVVMRLGESALKAARAAKNLGGAGSRLSRSGLLGHGDDVAARELAHQLGVIALHVSLHKRDQRILVLGTNGLAAL